MVKSIGGLRVDPAPQIADPTPGAVPPEPARAGVAAVVANLPESAVISALVNVVGSVVVHHAFEVPYDPEVMLTFGAIGTLIGAAYGPAKQALLHAFAGHAGGAGAPLTPEA